MARPLRIEYPGAFYHIIQRGIERKKIFAQDIDKEKFLSYLGLAHLAYNAIIHTYILMDNHYHIILETPRGNVSKIMHYLNTSYAAYFNARNRRVGPLYQGRFKAILVQQDEYLHHLSRYIHLNPIRSGTVKSPEKYAWSSYRYFIASQQPPSWINIHFILSQFGNTSRKAKRLYKQFVLDGIGHKRDIIKENTIKGCILGNEEFLKTILHRIKHKEDPEIPSLKKLKCKDEPTLAYIKRIVEEKTGDEKRLARKLSLYLSRKHTSRKLNQIASFYGKITDAGVSQACKRIDKARERDKSLNRLLQSLEKTIRVLNVET